MYLLTNYTTEKGEKKMVKSYGEFLDEQKYQSKKERESKVNGKGMDNESDDDPYYSVWNAFPSYKDIDKTDTLKKAISLVIIEFLFQRLFGL